MTRAAAVAGVAESALATDRLVATVSLLDDLDLWAPSALPGWTRAHVVAHLARHADALGNLFDWARTGVPRAMYASRHARDEEIERGSRTSAPLLFNDLVRSAQRLADRMADLPSRGWDQTVMSADGRVLRADELPAQWLREVRIHHVDLVADYTIGDWPSEFVATTTAIVVADLAARADAPSLLLRATDTGLEHRLGVGEPRLVEGEGPVLLAWLIGRPGHRAPTSPDGVLPRVPAWR